VKNIFAHAEEHHEELNLYITGEEETLVEAPPEATVDDQGEPEADLAPEALVEPEPDERRDP
jgi:hypothetical protein